jgi:hypothetical protein
MPGARIAVHELPDLALARDEEVRRYLQLNDASDRTGNRIRADRLTSLY